MTTIHLNKDVTKPSKSGALRRVLDLQAGRGDSAGLLDDLLLYFTAPPARRPAKSVMEWVARAVAAQDVRHYLTYLWVSPDGVAYGSDGHRAHFAAVEGVAPGFYDAKTLKPVEVAGKYPDVNRLMPSGASDQCVTLAELGQSLVHGADARGTEHTFTAYTSDGAAVMQAYLNDALNGCESMPIDVHGNIWTGVNDIGTYLIMGVRL